MKNKVKNKQQVKKQVKLEDRLYAVGLCLALAAPAVLLSYLYLRRSIPFLAFPCILRTFAGYYCPGCGGTRAVSALLHLQLWKSFCYHPAVPYTVFVYLWFMISHTIEKLSRRKLRIGMKWNPVWLWLAVAILFINVLIKDLALYFFQLDLLQMIR